MHVNREVTGALFIMLMSLATVARAQALSFPEGAATPSETCGECHRMIYNEFAFGVGSDNHAEQGPSAINPEKNLPVRPSVSSSATAHASSKYRPLASGGDVEWCRTCHFAGSFTIPGKDVAGKLVPNTVNAGEGSLTCATCHLTPAGKIRSVHTPQQAPHETVAEPALRTSAVCAHCHVDKTGQRNIGGQYQTYLEWREDFSNPGLGPQQCQDCHMPRTLRQASESSDAPPVAVGRHLWSGAHSRQRHLGSLGLTIIQRDQGKANLAFSVTNIGAGHSVPTGPFSRAVYLTVEALDRQGISRARKEWLFAPNYGTRPDDNAFLAADKKLSGYDAIARTQADTQGLHEPSIRAGEERRLKWEPALLAGEYTVSARLSYAIDRFKAAPACDRAEIGSATLLITAK
jgi:hypothetical protein